ncbi:MAG: trypsin-like peptidase domain-containing protein [Clostridia bacterium]|nr:trypsin-like peptidase domain-containing protein [Clostridia bacterium]
MKKTLGAVLGSLALVLAVSFAFNHWVMPLFDSILGKKENPKTYSQTNCLTDQITAEMDMYDIAISYRDGQAAVGVLVSGKNTVKNQMDSFHGSGVCVASKGYVTEDGYTASKGSYIATNYHVVSTFYENEYKDVTVRIRTEEEKDYSCSVLWADRTLDLAIIYCDGVNLNYVTMKDKIIFPEEGEKFDYEPIFTIGCPLDMDEYLNRMTTGNIGTNDTLEMYTTETVYPFTSNGSISYYNSGYTGAYEVLSTMYEDVVDITAGISKGNSGGGCFDENGYLIGLNTLGTSESLTAGNQMNGIVPIYPIMQILDRVIWNYETDETDKAIYSFENLGLYGIDAFEAAEANDVLLSINGSSYYYLNGKFYVNLTYALGFSYTGSGYYVLSSDGTTEFNKLARGNIITSCTDADGKVHTIENRNDFIYFMLGLERGDSVSVTIKTSGGATSTKTIQL